MPFIVVVKLARLYQPKNPLFWLLVILIVLSAAISWLLQTRPFSLPVTLLLVVFALGNFLLGLMFAVQLLRIPDKSEPADN